MKNDNAFVDDIIQKTKNARKKKKVVRLTVALSFFAIIITVIGFSNIITFSQPYRYDSYKNYLKSYASVEGEEMGLRIVDAKNAVVSVGTKAYVCKTQEEKSDAFKFSVMTENSDVEYFHVDFYDSSASVSWVLPSGQTAKRILNVTEELNIPSGLWHGVSEKALLNKDYESLAAGWKLLLDDGKSYAGEGMDSVWFSRFVTVGRELYECIFDVKSGAILDVSWIIYHPDKFDVPVMEEVFSSGNNDFSHYFEEFHNPHYLRLTQEDEKVPILSKEFTTNVIYYESTRNKIEKDDLYDESLAKWRLLKKEDTAGEIKKIDVDARLNLLDNEKAEFALRGKDVNDCEIKGKWYRLPHCILVVLNEYSPLVGKAFTVYNDNNIDLAKVDYSNFNDYSYTRTDRYDYYKTGYNQFNYYEHEEITYICWGQKYKEGSLPYEVSLMNKISVDYDVSYTFKGKYFKEYYDGVALNGEKFNHSAYLEEYLSDFSAEEYLTLVFRKDGMLEITLNGVTTTKQYFKDDYEITFSSFVLLNGEQDNIRIRRLTLDGGKIKTVKHLGGFEMDGRCFEGCEHSFMVYEFELVKIE